MVAERTELSNDRDIRFTVRRALADAGLAVGVTIHRGRILVFREQWDKDAESVLREVFPELSYQGMPISICNAGKSERRGFDTLLPRRAST